jgi:hypothetical protein
VRRIIIALTDDSISVEGLPDDVEVEVRNYCADEVGGVVQRLRRDDLGDTYVGTLFGPGTLPTQEY